MPLVPNYASGRFFVTQAGKTFATPLAVVLVTVETTDVVFAVDSIPAIFAVSRDPFIVYTSNVCAILGLRSMYFLLSGIVHRFVYLQYGLSVILVFVGLKMIAADFVHVPTPVSLGMIVLALGVSIAASLLRNPRTAKMIATRKE
jgi:tellurite resistance protein TerC